MTNLLILSSHGVLEYDDLRLFSRLGYDVFMPGGYEDPTRGNDLRPSVPEANRHPELAALVQEQRERHAKDDAGWPIFDWGKADLHPDLVEWADVIMVNCFPESWIGMQWARIRDKRVVWRTIGQSDANGELAMKRFRFDGLQIVRYSPAEKRTFERLGVFAGEDAMIRFGKDPADYGPWIGDTESVGNLAQHGEAAGDRDAWINWPFVLSATDGLPRDFVGNNAQVVGGRSLPYPDLITWLRRIRCLVYTGTQPASYTLGLMEAMLTGTPVVSIGPAHMWQPDLFEAHELAVLAESDPAIVRSHLRRMLEDPTYAANVSTWTLRRGLELFSYDVVGPQWTAFLGAPVRQEVAA